MTHQPKNVFLLNDTYLHSRHFGCEMVSSTFREQFARTGLNLIGNAPKEIDPIRYADKMKAADLIILNAEGTLHHNRNQHLLEIAKNHPCVMVNAVFEENEKIAHLLKNFLYISCRESLSGSYVESLGFDSDVNPDVIFSSMFLRAYSKRKPIHHLGVTDSVKSNKTRIGPFTRKPKTGFAAARNIVDYLEEFTSYEHLCIGRFHGVVIASMLGIPFSSWDSNTWKTRGLMQDMGAGHLHFSDQQEALQHVPEFHPESVKEFAVQAVPRINRMFDKIAEIANNT